MSKSLAINGGPKAVTNKLQGWPQFDENAIKAVEAVLRSGKVNYWTGKQGMEFEKRFAEWQGSRYAISVATGTAALHVALNSLGIGPGDAVILPSYQLLRSPGWRHPPVCGREPGRPLPQYRVGGEAGDDADQGDHARAPLRQRLRHGQDHGVRQAA